MFRSRAKIRLVAFSVFLFSSAMGRAEPQEVPASTTDAGVAQEVDAAEVSFTSALTAVDIPKLEQVLTEDFTWTHTSGDVEEKREYLRGVQETRRYRALQREGTSLRIYDRAALSFGIVHITVFTEDRGERILHLRYTAVYILQDGGWRLAARGTTHGLPNDPEHEDREQEPPCRSPGSAAGGADDIKRRVTVVNVGAGK